MASEPQSSHSNLPEYHHHYRLSTESSGIYKRTHVSSVMAKLFLNTFMFLLVVIGSSVGFPYLSEDEIATYDGLTAEISQAG